MVACEIGFPPVADTADQSGLNTLPLVSLVCAKSVFDVSRGQTSKTFDIEDF
jgi:hypothetical protein